MAGFPTRPSLTSFGAKRQDRSRPRSAIYDVGMAFINLVRWCLAGLGQSAPRAWVHVTHSGGSPTITAHGNAWGGAAPALSGTNPYTITFAESYSDADDQLVSPNLIAAVVSPKVAAQPRIADWDITSGRIVTVQLFKPDDMSPATGSFTVVLF